MSPLLEGVTELPVAHPDPVLSSKASPSLWHARSCAGALGVGFFAWDVCQKWGSRQCVLSSLTSSIPIPNPELSLILGSRLGFLCPPTFTCCRGDFKI